MKVFINNRFACAFDYEYDLIYSYVKNHHELVTKPGDADVILIIGTCTSSFEQISSTILEIKDIMMERKPGTKVILSGCITRKFTDERLQAYIDDFIKEQGIDIIIEEKSPDKILNEMENINKFIKQTCQLLNYANTHAQLHISNGCTNNCSFCKVCFQEIPLVSAPIEDVYDKLDSLPDSFKEVTLAGLNVCQYGLDLYHQYRLTDIIEYMEYIDHIEHINLLGFAFKDAIKGNFDEVIKRSSKVDTLIGSLESGSDRILKLMNKGYTMDEYIRFLDSINESYKKNLNLSIISGFPTETMDDVKETIRVIKEIKPQKVVISRYRGAELIPSGKLDLLSNREIKEHSKVYRKHLSEYL